MEIVGRPSRGCFLCRERHVKCSRERPECSKCIRFGRSCPGYAHQEVLLWANENERAERLATRPRMRSKAGVRNTLSNAARRPYSHENSTPERDDALHSSSVPKQAPRTTQRKSPEAELAAAQSHPPGQSLLPSMHVALQDLAICASFSTLVLPSGPDHHPGFLEFLPAMYASAGSDTPMRKALLALAQAKLANEIQSDALRLEAAMVYSQALSTTNRALGNRKERLKDETLAAICLLALYESVRGPDVEGQISKGWRAHADGTLLLLRLRGPEQLKTPQGRALFRLAHAPIQFKVLMCNDQPPPESAKLVDAIFKETPKTSAPPSRVAWYFDKVAKICAQIKRLMTTINVDNTFLPDVVLQILREAEEVNESMTDWDHHYPGWQPRDVSEREWRKAFHDLDYYTLIQSYTSLWTFGNHNKYRGARLLLHQSLLQCIEGVGETALRSSSIQINQKWATLLYHRKSIQKTAESIIASIPYALGELEETQHHPAVGGLQLVWFLGVIIRCPYAPLKYKEQAKHAAKRIGYEFGIRQALAHLS